MFLIHAHKDSKIGHAFTMYIGCGWCLDRNSSLTTAGFLVYGAIEVWKTDAFFDYI